MAKMLAEEPFTLPCGVVLPNRLCKAAMAENMADKYIPNDKFAKAYGEWADGGWGMILTGNAQVSRRFLGGPKDTSTPNPKLDRSQFATELEQWKNYAAVSQRSGTPTFVQIAHPGRQCIRFAGERSMFEPAVAPSPVGINIGDGLIAKTMAKVLYGTPRELTIEEIEGEGGIIESFVQAAKQCQDAGFKGVQLHGAHGYLLAEFLSPKMNFRTDAYGGTPAKRAEIIVRIIRGIRELTGPSFGVGIKMNSVDASESDSLDDTLEQVSMIVEAGIDFIELSGGSAENPTMMQVRSTSAEERKNIARDESMRESSWKREIFFIEFAETVRKHHPSVPLMVTGGFRTRAGIEAALKSGACDLVGIGRPAAILPKLPKEIIFNRAVPDHEAAFHLPPVEIPWILRQTGIKAMGAGAESMYYGGQIQKIGKGEKPDEHKIIRAAA